MKDRTWALLAFVLIGVVIVSDRVIAQLKAGVVLPDPIKPTTQRIIDAIETVYGRYGLTPMITSGTDGTHRENSLHYSGDALDVRRWDADRAGVTQAVINDLRAFLGPEYRVIVESDHFHIGYYS